MRRLLALLALSLVSSSVVHAAQRTGQARSAQVLAQREAGPPNWVGKSSEFQTKSWKEVRAELRAGAPGGEALYRVQGKLSALRKIQGVLGKHGGAPEAVARWGSRKDVRVVIKELRRQRRSAQIASTQRGYVGAVYPGTFATSYRDLDARLAGMITELEQAFGPPATP